MVIKIYLIYLKIYFKEIFEELVREGFGEMIKFIGNFDSISKVTVLGKVLMILKTG